YPLSETPTCPQCNVPYVPLPAGDKQRLPVAKDFRWVCPQCYGAIGEGESEPENLFGRIAWEQSRYLSTIQLLQRIKTPQELHEACGQWREVLDPKSAVRYSVAHCAPQLLRELWAAMDRIGGSVPVRPAVMNAESGHYSESFIQDVLRAIDD